MQIGKDRLALIPARHEAAGDGPVFAFGAFAGLEKAILSEQLGRIRVGRIPRAFERIVPPGTQSGQLFTPGRYELGFGLPELLRILTRFPGLAGRTALDALNFIFDDSARRRNVDRLAFLVSHQRAS